MLVTYMTSHISLQRDKINEVSDQMPCLVQYYYKSEPSIKRLVTNTNQNTFQNKETFGEVIIALNPLIDVFQLDFEKFECNRLIVCYSN